MKILFILALSILFFGCTNSTLGSENVASTSEKLDLGNALRMEKNSPIISKSGSVRIEIGNGKIEESLILLKEIIASVEGEIIDIRYYEYGNTPQYQLNVRMNPKNFERFSTELKSIGSLKDLSLSSEDVTKQYYDLESRIKNKEIELSRLQQLYNRSGTISEIVSIERELSRVETDLDLLKQQNESLSSKINKSSFSITIYEEKSKINELGLTIGDIGSMFVQSFSFGIKSIISIFGFVIPIAIVGFILWKIFVKVTRRN